MKVGVSSVFCRTIVNASAQSPCRVGLPGSIEPALIHVGEFADGRPARLREASLPTLCTHFVSRAHAMPAVL